jgi:hypothetical protein
MFESSRVNLASLLVSTDNTSDLYSGSYLEFRTMDEVLTPIDSERCTTSSEPFRFYCKPL